MAPPPCLAWTARHSATHNSKESLAPLLALVLVVTLGSMELAHPALQITSQKEEVTRLVMTVRPTTSQCHLRSPVKPPASASTDMAGTMSHLLVQLVCRTLKHLITVVWPLSPRLYGRFWLWRLVLTYYKQTSNNKLYYLFIYLFISLDL